MNFLERCYNFIKSIFLSGLFTIIPIALTLFFINFAYGFVYKILAPLRHLEPAFLQKIPGAEFLIATTLILVLGIILRFFLVNWFMHYVDRIFEKIPLVRIVYSSAKILVNFFQINKKMAPMAKKVVLIQYPREHNYHIAFLLESVDDSYGLIIPKANPDQKFYKVFMPHSPSPMTGYFFILPEQDIVHTDITFEEAIRSIVSCGLITPESLKKHLPKE